MKLSSLLTPNQPNITQIGSSLRLLLKRHWISMLITSFLSAFLLTLPSVFYLFNLQISQLSKDSGEQQQFTIFLQPDIQNEQIEKVLQQLNTLPNIAQTTLIDNNQALKEIQFIEGINSAINALGGVNPLHHSVIITLNKLLSQEEIGTLQQELNKIPNISEISLDEQWIVFIGKITSKLSNLFTAFAIISAMITSTLIFYFMLVRCMSSHAEMKLKFYLGAYPWQIYQPYLGFGLVIGALSGLIAMFLTTLCYHFYTSIWHNTVVQPLIYQPTISSKTLLYLLIISLLLSLISSFIATLIVHKNILKDYLSIQ